MNTIIRATAVFTPSPNACPVCGPQVVLVDAKGALVETQDHIRTAAELLRQGAIVAVKGTGRLSPGRGCRQRNHDRTLAVPEKGGRKKPLAVMSPDLEAIGTYARITPGGKGTP